MKFTEPTREEYSTYQKVRKYFLMAEAYNRAGDWFYDNETPERFSSVILAYPEEFWRSLAEEFDEQCDCDRDETSVWQNIMDTYLWAEVDMLQQEEEAEERAIAEATDDTAGGCSSCPEDECTGHCMSCRYR